MRRPQTALALLLFLLTLPTLAAITGVVMSSDGQAVSGARVSVYTLESSEARRARLLSAAPQRVPLVSAQTDAHGAFSLQSPREPVVDLRIDARGYEPDGRRVERDEETGAIPLARRELEKASITAGGKPVAGATVVLVYNGVDYIAQTDAQGRYEAPEPKRVRSITVHHPEYAIDEEAYTVQSASTSELTRTLSVGKAIAGRVFAADGLSPVAKATITIDQWPVGVTGEDGAFSIAHVGSKWTTLAARRDSLGAQRSYTTDQSVTLRLDRMATLGGRILDTKTKVPVSGAVVNVFRPRQMAGTFTTTTDAKGAYTIHVPAGSYVLMTSHPAYDLQSSDVSVTTGQRAVKDLTLTPLARVSGVVRNDEKQPVVAAAVIPETDMRMGMPGLRMVRPGEATVQTVSGPDGRFSTRVSTATELKMRAVKRGFPAARGETLRLTPGERRTGVVLTIPSGIAVSGVVKDTAGEPLSGVSVVATETPAGTTTGFVRRMVMRGMAGEEEDAVRTASDGTFTLRLKEGTYDFVFKREGYAPRETRAQNITVSGIAAIEATLDQAVQITGRITRGGMGVPDVMVNAMAENTSAMTGPDGSFTLGGLSAGPVRVMLFKSEELIQDQRSLSAPSSDVLIDLPSGGTIRGRVVEKGTHKAITTFDAGVSTSGSSGGMVRMAPPMLRNFNSEDGSFTLEHVRAGATNLVANAPGYASGRINVEVQEGKVLSEIVLELEAGARLAGKVTGASGTPLSDATVAVTPSPTGAFARSGAMRRTTTDANGEYTLESMDPGEETISISHPKHVSATRTVTVKSGDTRLDVQLEGGLRLTGVVVTEGGMPVADAEVRASTGGGGRSVRSDTGGAFELEAMSPGRYRFNASKSGYTESTLEDVDVSSGVPVRLVLGSGGTIYGRITGLAARDYAYTTVQAQGRTTSSAAVDPSGNFRIEGAPTGTVSIAATVAATGSFSDRRTSAAQTVQLEPGGSQQVSIEFPQDTIVRGRVTRNGAPLGGAVVNFASRSRAQATASVSADQQGLYSAAGLESGEYLVTVTDVQRFGMYTTTHNVRGSGTFDIDFHAGSVRGRVIDAATNEPIAEASVQLRPTAAENRAVRGGSTDSSGAFIVELVPAGSYVVTASGEGYGNQLLDLTVSEGGREGIELKLARNAGVTMSVVDGRDGRMLAAAVTVYDLQGRVIYNSPMVFGGTTGELRIPLSPGTYHVTVNAPRYAQRTFTIPSPSKQTVQLTPGGTLLVQSTHSTRRRIRLIDATGVPYPRFGHRASSFDLPPGTLPIENVGAGAYTLQLLNDDETVAASQQIVVREGTTERVEM